MNDQIVVIAVIDRVLDIIIDVAYEDGGRFSTDAPSPTHLFRDMAEDGYSIRDVTIPTSPVLEESIPGLVSYIWVRPRNLGSYLDDIIRELEHMTNVGYAVSQQLLCQAFRDVLGKDVCDPEDRPVNQMIAALDFLRSISRE